MPIPFDVDAIALHLRKEGLCERIRRHCWHKWNDKTDACCHCDAERDRASQRLIRAYYNER